MDSMTSLGLYEKAMPADMTLEEKMECARSFGYDFLELSIDETDAKLSRLDKFCDFTKSAREAIQNTGMKIGSICLSGHRKYPLGSESTATEARSVDIMHKAILLASELGIRIIQLAGYDVYYDESNARTKALFEKNIEKSVDIASKYAVMLAFETMETPFMDSVSKAMQYIEKVNSPYLQIYPDIGNCTNSSLLYGYSVTDDLLEGRGHIAAIHLKETLPGKYREIPYGEGHVDFISVVQTALDMGVRYFVTEFWNDPEMDHRQQIRYSKEFIDNIFKGVTVCRK